MNLEQLQIAIRPRRDWEAVDLGLLMARHWWWQLQRVWLLLTLPWLVAAALVPTEHLWMVSASLWWLKPLFERPLLMILSQGVFGVQLRSGDVLRALPRLTLRQWLPSLTWRRLSFSRSMDLPVIQLEGLAGSARRARLNVLHRDDSAPATWLTVIGVHLESFVALACAAVLQLFIPSEMNFDIWSIDFWFTSRPGAVLMTLFTYIAMAVVGPLFVACGFSLYLNRRVKLEGWDLEIAFKRMAQKRGLPTLALLVGLALFQLAPPVVPKAQADAAAERAAVREQIRAIKEGPDFHQMEVEKTLQRAERKPAKKPLSFDGLKFFSDLGKLLQRLAGLAEILLWALVLALVVWAALNYRRWLERFRRAPRRRTRAYQTSTLFGLAVSRDSLPADVGAAALVLWQSDQYRQALALLYRASLSELLQRGVPLRDGSTELECLQLARGLEQELALPQPALAYFAEVTGLWRQLAYGHRAPPSELGLKLCRDWSRSWADAAHA